MSERAVNVLRHLLPWLVSAAALGYVFGIAIDWESIPEATGNANLTLFIVITVADKLAFFLAWAFIQAKSIRDFVEPVSIKELISVKGAAELLRTGSNLLSDGAFLFGVSQLVRDRLTTVIAVIIIPFGAHFFVLLCQATFALGFLGAPAENLDVWIGVGVGWSCAGVAVILYRRRTLRRLLERIGLGRWADGAEPRKLLPIIGWFAVFAAFDVLIQGYASRAFGIEIPWIELLGRIPLLYVAISLPSFGNFGTREIAWSSLFAEYGTREGLVAFALWTNSIFAVMHALIGILFVGRAVSLWRQLRQARADGTFVRSPILHDPTDL